MGCIVSCLASCACQSACAAACKACSCFTVFRRCCGPTVVNLLYVLIVLAAMIAATILRYQSNDIGEFSIALPTGGSVAMSICRQEWCAGYFAVYRISFTIASFFVVMTLLTFFTCAASHYIHRAFWWLKILFIAGVLVGCFFAPNDVFAVYAWIARFVAPFFLLYQIIIFIDFGYTMNNKLVAKDERQDRFCCCPNGGGWLWRALLIVASLLLFAAAGTGAGLLYYYFPMGLPDWECFFNPLAVSSALVLSLLTTAVSLSAIAPHGALLTSALVTAYTLWFAFAAISAWPEPRCNALLQFSLNASTPTNLTAFNISSSNFTLSTERGGQTGELIVSYVLAVFSIGYHAFSLGRRNGNTWPASSLK